MSESVMTSEQWASLHKKLANLKTLADDPSATMGEATAATDAIRRLLFTYNMTMEDVKTPVGT